MLSGGSLAAVKIFLLMVRFVGHWGWIVPLVLLLLILVIGVRSWDNLGRWLGIPLLISGALIVGTVLLVKPPLLAMLTNAISSQMTDLLREEVQASFTRLSDHVFQPILLQGAIILGVGILMIVVMIITNGVKRKKAKAAVQAERKD